MRRRPPIYTRTDTLCPYTKLFRSLANLQRVIELGMSMPPVADRAVGDAEELADLPVDRPQRRQFARLLGILGFVGRNPGWVRAGAVGIVGHGLMSRMPLSFPLHASSAEVGSASWRERVWQEG